MEKNEQKKLLTGIMEADAKDGLYNPLTAVETLAKWMMYNVTEHSGDMQEAIDKALEIESYQFNDAFFKGVKSKILNKSPYNK